MKEKNTKRLSRLAKSPTGIIGLDEITEGGLPKGRPTLIAGNAGCGKTMLAMEFLVKGATQYKEPGLFVSFEESTSELIKNTASLGYDLEELIKEERLHLDHVQVVRSEIEETGEYDLEGLFIRLNYAIDAIKAKRVVLDTIESLFSGFSDPTILRAELRRLFAFLKEKGVTAVITGERGESEITRHGIEEYVSDCVILLDHRVHDQISTRRLRIVKYRGSTHGTNEYPYLIGNDGISVLPVTSLGLEHSVSTKRVSSGVPQLDEMLTGKGFYKGSTIMISGTAGSGKTSFAAHFANAACKRKERCLYLAFEESPEQITRNMRSIGIDLQPHAKKGLLQFHASRPSLHGLEMHLLTIHKLVEEFSPDVVIVDPMTNLITGGTAGEVRSMLTRLIDYLKSRQITAVFSAMTEGDNLEHTTVNVSSIIDSWILMRDVEHNGERNRTMYILKSRGMAHSNQVREFVLTDNGIQLIDTYVGPEGVLTGSSRLAQASAAQLSEARRERESQMQRARSLRRQLALKAQMNALQAELDSEIEETAYVSETESERQETVASDAMQMSSSRKQMKKGKK